MLFQSIQTVTTAAFFITALVKAAPHARGPTKRDMPPERNGYPALSTDEYNGCYKAVDAGALGPNYAGTNEPNWPGDAE